MVIFARDVSLTATGIVGTSNFRSVNIFDQSRCWGVWLPLPEVEDSKADSRRWRLDTNEHFVLSPIHPSAWPFLLRIQLFLEDKEGALADAARFLAKSGVNVMTSECTPAGYRHAIWTIIAHLSTDETKELAEKKKRADALIDQAEHLEKGEARKKALKKGWKKKQEVAVETTAVMQSTAEILRLRILAQNEASKGGQGFLRERIVEGQQVLLKEVQRRFRQEGLSLQESANKKLQERLEGAFKKEFKDGIPDALEHDRLVGLLRESRDPDQVEDVAKAVRERQFPGAVQCRWMSRMAYYAFAGNRSGTTHRFLNNEGLGTLDFEKKQLDWFESTGLKLNREACPAVAAFHTRDNYLRISPFPGGNAEYITVPYSIRRRDGPGDAGKGLLSYVSKQIAKSHRAPSNFLHQVQRYTAFDGATERGDFTFLVNVHGKKLGDALSKQKGKDLRERLNAKRGPKEQLPESVEVRLGKVRSRPFGVPKLFVSTRFVTDDYFLGLLKQCARDAGFLPVIGDAGLTQEVTKTVVSQIQSCDAAAFVIYSTPEELYDSNLQRLAWLQHEMGMAIALQKPTAKLVDTLLRDEMEKLFPLDRERSLKTFDRWITSPDVTKEKIHEWLTVLRNEISYLG